MRIVHTSDWRQLTRSQLRTILFDYIETFNRARHQSRLEHPIPAETYAASRAA